MEYLNDFFRVVVIGGIALLFIVLLLYTILNWSKLPCIEDEHRKLKPEDVEDLKLVSTPNDHENVFIKMYRDAEAEDRRTRAYQMLAEVLSMEAKPRETEEKEMIKNEKMPELQLGDVVKWEDGAFGMVGKTRIWSLVELDGLIVRDGDGFYNPRKDGFNKDAVERIYRRGTGFDQEDLLSIYKGIHPEHMEGWILWRKPEVREMTVDQISEELGYTVKVVGEQK